MTTRDVILKLYEDDPDICNDEGKLFQAVAREKGVNISLELIRMLPNWDDVQRRRRELHEEGKIKYSEQAERKRYKRFIEERDKHSDYTGTLFNVDNTRL